jgi:hypothetical protein
MKPEKTQSPEPMGFPGGMAEGESPAGAQSALLEKLLNEGPSHVAKIEATFRCETYTLYRPWHVCGKCKDAVYGEEGEPDEEGNRTREAPTEMLPDTGDRTCPHVNNEAYQQTVQKIYDKKWRHLPFEPSTLSSGTVQVTVQWWETKEIAATVKRKAAF